MKIFNHCLQGHEATLQNAIDHANGLDWQSVELTEQELPKFADYKRTIKGIDIYYDCGCCMYLFVEPEK